MRLKPGNCLFPIILLVLILNPAIHFEQISGSTENISEIPEGLTVFNRDMTYEGDLVIDGNKSVVIENCNFDIKGRINMSNSSTLVLRNAKIRLVESREGGEEDSLFWFSISGNSRFQAINVTIETIFFQSFSIHVSDSADVVFDDVYSLEWYGLVCEGSSKVKILNSVCWSMIETRDESVLSVRDSKIYGVNVTGDSRAFLEGIHTTRISVAEAGSIEIYNSTIRSETDGLELIFDEDTKLTLENFSATSSGIEYEFCESWNLYRDNEISNAHLNVTIERVYLKSVRFVITEKSDVNIHGMRNPFTSIICSNEDLDVIGSDLNEIVISKYCVLHASSAELVRFQATEHSSARIDDSKIGFVVCKDESTPTISSSEIGSIECHDAAILQLINCSIPESTTVSDNSIIFHTLQPTSMSELDYDIEKGTLTTNIMSHSKGEAQLEMILNRDRIRDQKTLKIVLDGEAQSHKMSEKKDLKMISFLIPPGVWHLSISLGPPPPERVPFFLTLVGQQLISLTIIIILVIAILIAWR